MLITVIIPVFNRADTLPRLFRSLRAQTYRPLEIILVDNGSTDASLQLCRDFQAASGAPGFSVRIEEEPRRGACCCRNLGLRHASGEFVYFFDSDDEMSADFLPACRPWLDRDLVGAPTVMVFPDGHTKVRDFYPTGNPADQILTGMLSTQSFIVRTAFAREAGGWDETLPRWNDWELGVRLLLHRPQAAWLPHPFHRIHQHARSISGKRFTDDLPHLMRAARTVETEVRQLSPTPAARRTSLTALGGKLLTLAAALHREGSTARAAEVKAAAMKLVDGWLRRGMARCIWPLAAHGMRGAWRLYRWLSR